MYSSCLFCHASLGRNESIEHFPIGNRLAFDAAKGRLWVVCQKCARWNLSPIEERWEAIDELERAYRDTKKRAATDNIGMARLNDGTDVIRIGAPLLPEFASWRYGDQFVRRRRQKFLQTGGAVLVHTSMAAVAGFLIGPLIMMQRSRLPIAKVRRNDGVLIGLTRDQLATIRISLVRDDRLHLQFKYWNHDRISPFLSRRGFKDRMVGREPEKVELSGNRAKEALSKILPGWNGYGGTRKTVSQAVEEVEHFKSIHELVRHIPQMPAPDATLMKFTFGIGVPHQLHSTSRLALEMMLHEDSERRAMEGELKGLALRWKEADEIAGIADSLTLPDNIRDRIANKKKGNST